MTGQRQCDHIVGMVLSSFPQEGEVDFLARISQRVEVDEPFRYCPLCGAELCSRSNAVTSFAIEAAAASI